MEKTLQLLQLRFSTGVWKFTAQDFIFCTFYYTFSLSVVIVTCKKYNLRMWHVSKGKVWVCMTLCHNAITLNGNALLDEKMFYIATVINTIT